MTDRTEDAVKILHKRYGTKELERARQEDTIERCEADRRRLAEFMGWHHYINWSGTGWYLKKPCTHDALPNVRDMVMRSREWDPFSRWDHAGMLWDTVPEKYPGAELTLLYDERGWDATIELPPYNQGPLYTNHEFAETAPAAISEAVLGMMGEEPEQTKRNQLQKSGEGGTL